MCLCVCELVFVYVRLLVHQQELFLACLSYTHTQTHTRRLLSLQRLSSVLGVEVLSSPLQTHSAQEPGKGSRALITTTTPVKSSHSWGKQGQRALVLQDDLQRALTPQTTQRGQQYSVLDVDRALCPTKLPPEVKCERGRKKHAYQSHCCVKRLVHPKRQFCPHLWGTFLVVLLSAGQFPSPFTFIIWKRAA